MSQFETIVHHTVSDRGDPDFVEANAPFPVNNIGQSYLGSGYYFWDDHIELAHYWGEVHCDKKYMICKGELTVDKNVFFDLVGCRQDTIYLQQLISKIPELKNLTIGEIIEFLKDLNLNPNKAGIFPFKVIRAVDVSLTGYKQEIKKFAERKFGKMTLSPLIIICLVERNKLHLKSLKIIHPTEYLNG